MRILRHQQARKLSRIDSFAPRCEGVVHAPGLKDSHDPPCMLSSAGIDVAQAFEGHCCDAGARTDCQGLVACAEARCRWKPKHKPVWAQQLSVYEYIYT